MAESVPSNPGIEGMQETLDPHTVSHSRPLRADFSFPPAQIIRRGFQLAMAKLNRLRRSRWDKPPLKKSPDPHAGRSDSEKRDLNEALVQVAAEDVIRGFQALDNAFQTAAETMPAETMLHIRNELAKGCRLITIPTRALENLPLVDPHKAWRD